MIRGGTYVKRSFTFGIVPTRWQAAVHDACRYIALGGTHVKRSYDKEEKGIKREIYGTA